MVEIRWHETRSFFVPIQSPIQKSNFQAFPLETIKMSARPTVTVFNAKGVKESSAKLPSVFSAPIRTDIVQFVHTNVAKNKRQVLILTLTLIRVTLTLMR